MLTSPLVRFTIGVGACGFITNKKDGVTPMDIAAFLLGASAMGNVGFCALWFVWFLFLEDLTSAKHGDVAHQE